MSSDAQCAPSGLDRRAFPAIYRGGQVTAEADSDGTLTLGYNWGLGPDDLVGIRHHSASQHYYVV